VFKRLLGNPIGIAITAAALVLTISPEARNGTRKLLVKGTAALLSVGDSVKQLSIGARKEMRHLVQDAKEEKEQLTVPDFSEMVKNVGESTKTKVNQVFQDMKMNVGEPKNFAHSMEMGEELSGDLQEELQDLAPNPKKNNKNNSKNNKGVFNPDILNVLSDETINSALGKPPLK
jgi:hypothetical protein